MKNKAYFYGKNENQARCKYVRFKEKSNWVPKDHQLDPSVIKLTDKIKSNTAEFLSRSINGNQEILKLNEPKNLSKEEQHSLKNLRSEKNILIKPADKGGATVIMNTENYILEAERQLNNGKYYRKLNEPIFTENISKIKAILSKMLSEKYIDKQEFKFLSGPEDATSRTFYLLPKIHKKPETWPQPKKMPEGRPIVSDVNSETYRISEYLDYFINPLATKHDTYVKNTYDFVNKIRNFAITSNCLLVTGDVTALYTNMNIDRSIECVRKAFLENPNSDTNRKRPDNYLLQLLELSMKNNDFEFAGKHFLQIMGTAMGKRFAPALANLYLLDFDNKAKNDFEIKPLLFFRYLDDIFFLWPGDVNSLKRYENFLNELIPDIKVTLEHSPTEINFLDTTVYVSDEKLHTRIYFKPTDTHQLLHKSSFHPKHTFKGILKSQFIRFKRISSNKTEYDNTSKILCAELQKRGYSFSEMRKVKSEVWFNYVEKEGAETQENCPVTLSHKKSKNETSLLPIVVDHCSIGMKLSKEYRNLLKQDEFFNKFNLVTAYKNDLNLKQLLVRSRLPSDKMGAFRGCGNQKCKTCKIYAHDTDIFQSSTTGSKFSIASDLTCSSSNIVYLITCNKCKKQYVGETGRTLRERMTDHRSAIKLNKKTPIGIHFNEINHSHLDIKIVAIEAIKTLSNAESIRKKREQIWQKKLNTIFPAGLNNMPTE